MIFVTVGTHEQSFIRLIKKIDELKEKKIIDEDVFIQKGFTDYKPKYCQCRDMISFQEMNKLAYNARIIITHGGPGSIMLAWQYNKIPIVVPRNPEYGEHVDEHQILFAKRLEKLKKIIAVYDINDLADIFINYNDYIKEINIDFKSNTINFCNKLDKIVNNLLKIR